MLDAGVKDHKIIAVATADPEYNSYHEARELPAHKLAMVRRFLQDYKRLERTKVEVDTILPAAKATRSSSTPSPHTTRSAAQGITASRIDRSAKIRLREIR